MSLLAVSGRHSGVAGAWAAICRQEGAFADCCQVDTGRGSAAIGVGPAETIVGDRFRFPRRASLGMSGVLLSLEASDVAGAARRVTACLS
jgi:hypothetical protein